MLMPVEIEVADSQLREETGMLLCAAVNYVCNRIVLQELEILVMAPLQRSDLREIATL